MTAYIRSAGLYIFSILVAACFLPLPLSAQEAEDFPKPMSPPRLVNDFAAVLSPDQQQMLENKLLEYERSSSTQITIVTLRSIGGYAPAQYGVELFNRWNIGTKGKDNGVLLLAAINDRKVNITTGYGLEGALTDAMSGRIIRNEIVPSFREERYYDGFVKATEAIIAATKGEYKAGESSKDKPGIGIVAIILIVYLGLWLVSRIGGGGGGSYMSGRGGRTLGGGGWFGGGGFGGGSGGGFGGFGGGRSGGGGASGSW